MVISAASLAAMISLSSSSAEATGCDPTTNLALASNNRVSAAAGVDVRNYNFGAGVANRGPYQSRFSVSKGFGALTNLTPTLSKIGWLTDQRNLASDSNSLVHVNGNYYDFNNYQPEGPIGINGRYVFTRPGRARVLGLESKTATLTTGISGQGRLTYGTKHVSLTGANIPTIDTNGINLYTSAYSETQLPSNDYALLITAGKVAQKLPQGTLLRPTSGSVIVGKGTSAQVLAGLKVGQKVMIVNPKGKYSQPNVESVTPNLSISRTGSRIVIDAVNYLNGSLDASLVIYDSNWAGSAPSSLKTIYLNASGQVTASASGGYQLKAFDSTGLSDLVGVSVGQKYSVNLGWRSTSGKVYGSLIGFHSLLVNGGRNVVACSVPAEEIRPRTAIAWDSNGHLFLATTTMGRAWADGGYRIGGSTMHQLSDWLLAVGATGAVGMDGGGSTTMYVRNSSAYTRADLPDYDWVRSIPEGIALIRR